jgi:hypothetical protein
MVFLKQNTLKPELSRGENLTSLHYNHITILEVILTEDIHENTQSS